VPRPRFFGWDWHVLERGCMCGFRSACVLKVMLVLYNDAQLERQRITSNMASASSGWSGGGAIIVDNALFLCNLIALSIHIPSFVKSPPLSWCPSIFPSSLLVYEMPSIKVLSADIRTISSAPKSSYPRARHLCILDVCRSSASRYGGASSSS
jgi:hypothetical protein